MGLNSYIPVLLLAAALGTSGCRGTASDERSAPRVVVVESAPMVLDRIYPSMEGPSERVALETTGLDWVTAYKTEVVDAETDRKMGDEFFCHSQMQMTNATRLVVTATGSEEIRLPDGFAMPVTQILSGLGPGKDQLMLLGMILNNHDPDIDRLAKVRWTIEYASEEDLSPSRHYKRIYKVGLPITVKDIAEYHPDGGAESDDDLDSHCVLVEGLKTHWLVPPGPQRTRTEYSDFMPVDGTVHYIVVHLHNYGVFMRLNDLTTGEMLWQTDVVYERDRKQIVDIPVYSSVEGFPIRKDHVYEVEAFYDNTTDHDVDAMAMLDFYYHPLNDETIYYPNGPAEPSALR